MTEPLNTEGTNAEALRKMAALNLEALAVVDRDRDLMGVVEREDVVSRMVLELVDQ